jgi:predicted secreted Zn-dependent protease
MPKRHEASSRRHARRGDHGLDGRGSSFQNRAKIVCLSRHAWLGLCLLFFPLLAKGASTLVWTTNYYIITGSNMREIMESMDQMRPAKITAPMTACTEWRMWWHFAVVPSPGGWRCDSFTTRLVITNTLPRWTPPTNATPQLLSGWRRMFWNTARHEGGHSEIALAALAEVHRRVKELPDDPDYDGFRGRVNAMIRSVLDEYKKMDDDYDRRTQHGRWQGVAVPYSPPLTRKESVQN